MTGKDIEDLFTYHRESDMNERVTHPLQAFCKDGFITSLQIHKFTTPLTHIEKQINKTRNKMTNSFVSIVRML